MAVAVPPLPLPLAGPLPGFDPSVFSGLATLAATVAGAPMAGVFLLTPDGLRRGAWHGTDPVDVPLRGSPCGLVITAGDVVALPDLAADPRLGPCDPGLGAYAGAPVTGRDGRVQGIVAVLDREPRPFADAQLDGLRTIADQVRVHLDRDRALADVAASRGRMEAVVEGLGDALLFVDEDDGVGLPNGAFADIVGLRRDAGETVTAVELQAALDRTFDEAARSGPAGRKGPLSGRPQRDEIELADGRVFIREYTPLDLEGRRGHLWHMRDVTERRRAEARLASSERRFAALAAAAPVGIVALDPAGRNVFANHVANDLYGFDTVPDREWWHAVVEEERPRVQAAWDAARGDERPFRMRYGICDPGGARRELDVHIAPVHRPDGALQGFVGSIDDVTAEAEASRALARSEAATRASHARLAATIAGALDCIVALDPEGRILDLNPAAQRRFKCVPRELAGRPFAALLATDAPPLQALMGRRTELTGRDAEGRTFPAEVAMTRIEGATTAYVRDISDAQRAQRERERRLALEREARLQAEAARTDLEARNGELLSMARVKDDFIATVSHELRTPLTSIQAFLDLLEDDPDLTDAQREALEVIGRNATRLHALVSGVLELRNRAPAIEAVREVVDLERIADLAVTAGRPRAAAAGIVLSVAPGGHGHGWGDAERLAQAVDCLVDNALKFTPAGGAVTLRVRTTERGCCIDVQDAGPGVDEEDRRRLFEPFYRGAASKAMGRGSGLGLSIAARLLEAQGGAISVRSTPGEGATFTVELERAEA